MLQHGWNLKYYAKGKKWVTKGYLLYISIYRNFQDRQIHRDWKQINSCQRLRVKGDGQWLLMGMWFLLGVTKMFWKLDMGDGCTTLWIYLKKPTQFKWILGYVNCTKKKTPCFRNTIPFTTAPKEMQCIGSISRKLQNTYERNKDLNRWRDLLCLLIRRCNIVNISIQTDLWF